MYVFKYALAKGFSNKEVNFTKLYDFLIFSYKTSVYNEYTINISIIINEPLNTKLLICKS